jgi:predicted MPP superfamily phosphohydrolase
MDLYIFQAIKTISTEWQTGTRRIVFWVFWAVSAITLAFILAVPYLRNQVQAPAWRIYPLAVMIGILIAKMLSLVFFMVDDVRRLVQWVVMQLLDSSSTPAAGDKADTGITRSTFLSWMGLAVGGTVFGTLLYGFRNQYNYQVKKLSLSFDNLPDSFKGLRVVQISDIHSGSFMNESEVEKGISIINGLNPDIIFFTGDLVNDRAGEMEPFIDIFSKLKAPYGVFSTLGNHDYGDYIQWPSQEAKLANLEKLKGIHEKLGWRLLLDESVTLERKGATIGVIGVQNISGKNSFHSYGNLQKAYRAAAGQPFKILLSHDPSHWDSEVRPAFPDIDLTLSGHTHGMQFGVELPWFRWSPVQWMYRQWAGLYEQEGQKLYVNRGFGFIGYPGRVGILPEVTLIELA